MLPLFCGSGLQQRRLMTNPKITVIVIPAKAGTQCFQLLMDHGACPGPDLGFVGVTD